MSEYDDHGNTAVGENALLETLNSGNPDYDNTAMGFNALRHAIANENTAVGSHALFNNVNGEATAVGAYAAANNGTAGATTAVGNWALRYHNGANNTAVGHRAMANDLNESDPPTLGTASYNTAVGVSTLRYNMDGHHNTAVGHFALNANNATDNTAIGDSAMISNVVGERNTAVGKEAMKSNYNGDDNTAFGYQALQLCADGSLNSAFGAYTLKNNPNGDFNSAYGGYALHDLQSGNDNAAYGHNALKNLQNGSYNVAIGATTPMQVGANGLVNYNTYVGGYTSSGPDATQFATAIGGQAKVDTSNSVVIGRERVNDAPTSDAGAREHDYCGIGTTKPKASLDVNGGVRGRTSAHFSSQSTGYTATNDDYIILIDASFAAFALVLPTPTEEGHIYIVRNIGVTNNVTVSTPSGVIKGSSSSSIAPDKAYTYVSFGTDYHAISSF